MMKSVGGVAMALLVACGSIAEAARVPQWLRIKGRFTDSTVPLTDNLPVRFSVWDTPDGYGNLMWEDIQTVAIQNDTFQVVLGRAKALPPSVFSGGDRWVELQIGNDAPMRPRHRIPYKFIQAQVAAQQAPPPVVVPPPAPVVAAPTDQERRELELQIEKYKEVPAPAPAPVPAPEPVKPVKNKHIVVRAIDSNGTLGPTYAVQSGDTLKSIAQKLYGNAELWYDLYYLNRDRLGPMGHLFTGQILVLPTQKSGEGLQR